MIFSLIGQCLHILRDGEAKNKTKQDLAVVQHLVCSKFCMKVLLCSLPGQLPIQRVIFISRICPQVKIEVNPKIPAWIKYLLES